MNSTGGVGVDDDVNTDSDEDMYDDDVYPSSPSLS